jgi:hydrogenase maturation protein HypF
MGEAVRFRVRVEGIVQGVGFRPFVHAIAHRHALAGHVGNDGDGVFIEVEGDGRGVDAFLSALRAEAPPLSTIDAVVATAMPVAGDAGFRIVDSRRADGRTGGERRTGVSADTATCDDCLREMADPGDRRFGYPFVNCTNCGPRYTIVRDVPYDRPATTMSGFRMCPACAAEYHDPGDRRFHAQPICCPDCGPRLALVGAHAAGDPIVAAAALLRGGAVVAVKGLGGYHLAADATDDAATGRLRSRKHREDKPFAVMVADLDRARDLCDVDDPAAALLTDRRRPIVLLPRRAGATALAEPVAPGNREIGLMLPYAPVHHLLLAAVAGPIVLTSGNVSDEPIAYADDDARTRLSGIADAYLTHDRPIHVRTDDSVARIRRGRPTLLRRARGYAPEPLRLAISAPVPILACGAELKNTFCLLKDDRAVMSQHIGDLENHPTLRSYAEGIDHLARLFDISPRLVAYDLHPEYLSTKYALDLAAAEAIDAIGVQHHHAHIASCLADNGVDETVIGVAYDGTGFGTDGTIWGGEFLVADLAGFERAGHLAPVPLPGGTAAIRQPWRMAVAYLDAAYGDDLPDLPVLRRHADTWPAIVAMGRRSVNAPPTSSAGRLFDAVAALLDIRDDVNYEGQAAIELEQRADPGETVAYAAAVRAGTIHSADLIRSVVEDLHAGTPASVIAARFHNGLVAATARMCTDIRSTSGLTTVALSGGVFQNTPLTERLTDALERAGFRVLTHERVPPNDGGISLGQAAIAAARTRPC